MITELRQHIKEVLSSVNTKNAPTVFKALESETGYKNIEDTIIKMMIQENITASACIVHIENSL